MPDLSSASPDELRAELERREKAAGPTLPEAKASTEIDWSKLRDMIVEGVNDSIERGYQDKDFKGYVYEAALEAVYGAGYWTWRNAQKW